MRVCLSNGKTGGVIHELHQSLKLISQMTRSVVVAMLVYGKGGPTDEPAGVADIYQAYNSYCVETGITRMRSKEEMLRHLDCLKNYSLATDATKNSTDKQYVVSILNSNIIGDND
jgi:hypothetical protein